MKAGLITAVATVGAGEAPSVAAEQLALLPAAPGETVAEAVGAGERRIGRPPGARNRRTAETVDWLLHHRGLKSPLEFLMEIFNEKPEQTARRLGMYRSTLGETMHDADGHPIVDLGEAAKLQVNAAIAALPYIHQKQPIAVEAAGKTPIALVLPGEGGTAEEQAADMGFDLEILPNGNMQITQQLSDDDLAQSDDGQSDAEPK